MMPMNGKVPVIVCLVFIYSKVTSSLADSLNACKGLPVLQNGRLLLEEKSRTFLVGESIGYICDEGYVADLKSPKIVCSEELGVPSWISTDTVCNKLLISCNDPGEIENAHRVGNVFTFPHNITYVCKDGFKLQGSGTRYCSPEGHWLPQAPTCDVILCPFLSELQNGKILSSDRTLHSIVRYECDQYFELHGNIERTCQNDGTWTGDAPICKEITCLSPGAIKNVRVIPSQSKAHKAGNLVIFKCKYGSHQISSKCLETGEWSKRPPICPGPDTESTPGFSQSTLTPEPHIIHKLSCDHPGKIKNGKTTFSGLSINSTVIYTCEEGYELRGGDTLLCMANGKWDLEKLPICVKPLSIPSIILIVFGILILIALGVGFYAWYRWRDNKFRGFGKKSKALTADATNLEEIAGLEKYKTSIPVTVL